MNTMVQVPMDRRLPIGAPVMVGGRLAHIRGRTFGDERYDVEFEDRTAAVGLPRSAIKPVDRGLGH